MKFAISGRALSSIARHLKGCDRREFAYSNRVGPKTLDEIDALLRSRGVWWHDAAMKRCDVCGNEMDTGTSAKRCSPECQAVGRNAMLARNYNQKARGPR